MLDIFVSHIPYFICCLSLYYTHKLILYTVSSHPRFKVVWAVSFFCHYYLVVSSECSEECRFLFGSFVRQRQNFLVGYRSSVRLPLPQGSTEEFRIRSHNLTLPVLSLCHIPVFTQLCKTCDEYCIDGNK